MPVSYQDFVLSNQYFGTPMPTDPTMKMELTPIVYQNMRTIGARPSRLQQGLRAVGRGLAIAGGAGVAVGVANSLFNKPSDNYAQSVTNNQTTGGRNTRVGQLDSFDQFFETDNEKYAKTGGLGESSPPSKSTTPAQTITAQTDQYLAGIGPDTVGAKQYDATIGPHSLASATGIGRKPRMAKLGGSEFSQALRRQEQDSNIAAFKAENEAALRGESPTEYQISAQEAADIAAAENMPASPTVQAAFSNPHRHYEDLSKKDRSGIHAASDYMDRDFKGITGLDTPEGRAESKEAWRNLVEKKGPITERTEDFILNGKKNLPEKKTPKVTNLREYAARKASGGLDIVPSGKPPADMAEDLKEFDDEKYTSDFYYKGTGETEKKATTPQDVSPRGVIPPDKSGTMNKTDLSAIGDIIGEKQADNPIVGGLQGIGKAARIAGKLGKRTVEELADKGAKDRRNYAKYKETIRKAQAFKKIAEDRENTKDSE